MTETVTNTTTNTRLAGYRERRDQFFGTDEHSPLSAAQKARFAGLDYFAERPDLVFELPLETDNPRVGETVTLNAGDGGEKEFTRAGTVTFPVDGTPVTLWVFREVDRGRYFVPFRDGTAGKETYPVGRYLDPRARPDGSLVIDFNYAYNPYCAYSSGWTCPIPPRENVVKTRIEAGERAYADPEHGHGTDDEGQWV